MRLNVGRTLVGGRAARGGALDVLFVAPSVNSGVTIGSLRDLARLVRMLLGLTGQELALKGPRMAAECVEHMDRAIGRAGVKGNNTFRFLREAHQLDIACLLYTSPSPRD